MKPETPQALQVAVSTLPRPGAFYRIRKGDTLLTVAGKAYGVGAGSRRLAHAKRINMDPFNRRYWRAPADDFSRKNFKAGIISFSPRFACDNVGLLEERDGPAAKGHCFALLWLPPLPVPTSDQWIDTVTTTKHPVLGAPGGNVTNHLAEPFSWICYILAEFDDPDGGAAPIRFGGTGVLISPRHVLTAAHVVYPHEVVGTGTPPTSVRTSPNRLEVLRALHTDDAAQLSIPERFIGLASSTTIPSEWVAAADPDHDFAIVDLGPKANARGWWGSKKQFPVSSGVDPASLLGRKVHAAGYAGAYMYFDANQSHFTGAVEAVGGGLGNTVQHRTRVFEGMSGGPVWTVAGTGQRKVATLIGINSSVEQRSFDFSEFLNDPAGPIEVTIRTGLSDAVLLTPFVLQRLRKQVPLL